MGVNTTLVSYNRSVEDLEKSLATGHASGGGIFTEQGILNYANQIADERAKLSKEDTGSSTQSTDQIAAAVKSLQGNISQPAPGQDQYSKALEGMMTGSFSPNDPSYKWRLGQGQQAVERSQAAKGLLGSGNVLTALTDYAQGSASQEYQAQFQRLLSASQNATSQYDSAITAFAKMAGVDLGQQQQNLAVKSEADQYNLGLGNLGVAQGSLGLKQSEFGYQKALQSGKDQAAADALASYNSKLTPDASTAPAAQDNGLYSVYTTANASNPSSGYTNGGDFMGYPSGSGAWSSSSGGSGTFGGEA
jgi:hypothetical protein